MTAKYSDLGFELLYPENWTIAERADGEAAGVTFDLPSGGFLSIDPIQGDPDEIEALYQQMAEQVAEDYGEYETETLDTDQRAGVRRMVEFRFYYLDLIIQSHLMVVEVGDQSYVVQYQAESRDFEKNEAVFDAILAQMTSG